MLKNKLSPDLNIAINIEEEERKRSLELNVGYLTLQKEWELIVRYSGDLEEIKKDLQVKIEILLGGYAIFRLPQYLIAALSNYPQVLYIEKPKSLILEEMEGIAASCINRRKIPNTYLTGEGTLLACLDSGVDFYHKDFRNQDGTTRILTIWDQTVMGNPPTGFTLGSVYTQEEINEALLFENDIQKRKEIVPEFDATGHGTAVLGIMAGNGFSSDKRIVGVAPKAELIVVKLGNPMISGFPRTTNLMLAIDYSVRYAMRVHKPLVINISYGNNYGSHNGDSMLEGYIDAISKLYRLVIVVGCGNEGLSARHASYNLKGNKKYIEEIYVSPYVKNFNLQIWKQYIDRFQISIITPTYEKIGPLSEFSRVQKYDLLNEDILAYYGEPVPDNPQQEVYISWIPKNEYITEGIWKIELEAKDINVGFYNMWLPVASSTSAEVYFMQSVSDHTILIPATARSVITVAAYNSINDTYAAFSGRGNKDFPLIRNIGEKPDLAAPGVDINTCQNGGGYGLYTGTSFAAPFVSGASALLMQYGIVEGNDPYLYGEKVRAVLIDSARKLPFQVEVPSILVGYGALCLKNIK